MFIKTKWFFFFFLSSEITSQMLCLQIRQNFNLLLDSLSSISRLSFWELSSPQGSLLHVTRRSWWQSIPEHLDIHILSTPLHSNSIPHHLSLIRLALKWKHPSPCVHCEKFLGFVSWIFHGKQNRIFSPPPGDFWNVLNLLWVFNWLRFL